MAGNMQRRHASSSAPPHNTSQSGFNLIGLIVSIVIGLFITLGLSQMLVNIRNTASTQNQLSQFKDNEHQSITMLTNIVQLAGYYPNSNGAIAQALLPATRTPDGAIFTAGTGISGTTGHNNDSDTINLAFTSSGSDGILDCQGGNTNTQTLLINSFSIVNKQLVCSVNGTAPLVLATGISRMKIMFGVDSQKKGSTDSYLSAADVEAAKLWAQVRLVIFRINYTSTLYNTQAPVWVQSIHLMRLS